MQYASVRAENSIQAVFILITAFLPDQCWHFWDASLRSKKVRWKMKCSQLLLIWQLSSILKRFRDEEREERIARISAWKLQLKRDQRQPIHNLSSHYYPLLSMFLRSLVPHRYSRWARATSHWEKINLNSIFHFPLCISIFQSAVFCSFSVPTTGYGPGDDKCTCKWFHTL